MNILLICSKKFYDRIPEIKASLEAIGHNITLPNCFLEPHKEDECKKLGDTEHARFKAQMFMQSERTISRNDAVLVLNFDKNLEKNYIGGATFLEMYDAFRLKKLIFLYNDIPEGILRDEIVGFSPVVIHGDLSKIIQ